MESLTRKWRAVKVEKRKAMELLAVASFVIVSPRVLPVLRQHFENVWNLSRR